MLLCILDTYLPRSSGVDSVKLFSFLLTRFDTSLLALSNASFIGKRSLLPPNNTLPITSPERALFETF